MVVGIDVGVGAEVGEDVALDTVVGVATSSEERVADVIAGGLAFSATLPVAMLVDRALGVVDAAGLPDTIRNATTTIAPAIPPTKPSITALYSCTRCLLHYSELRRVHS